MQFFPSISVLLALVASIRSVEALDDKPLPWDGRAYNLTVETLDTKFLTETFILRNFTSNGNPADYVKLTRDARPEGFNDDTAALSIGVDGKAIYSNLYNYRMSNLAQHIAGNVDGTTFFRASVTKADAFLNAYDWKMISLGSGIFHIGVDASVTPAIMYYRTNDTSATKWKTEFTPGTSYNFGIGLEKSTDGNSTVLEFYTSTGLDQLTLNTTTELEEQLPTSHTFYVGLETKFLDGSSPVMNNKQNVVSFSGVSAEATAINAGAPTPAPSSNGTSAEVGNEARDGLSFDFDDRK